MARPKKTSVSGEVGSVPVTRKRGNPDFSVSSFYIPKKLNLAFDRAILTLKAADFDVDRSDVLAGLISRFVDAVGAAEREMEDDGGFDLKAVLEASASGSVVDSAGMSLLKEQLQRTLNDARETVESYQTHQKQKDAANEELVSLLMSLIPEEHVSQLREAEKKRNALQG